MLPLDATANALVESLAARLWRSTHAANGKPTHRRRRLGCLLGLGLHGLRISEICNARRTDLHPRAATLYVRTSKRGHNRTINLNPEFAAALATLATSEAAHAPLIPSEGSGGKRHLNVQTVSVRMKEWLHQNVGPWSAHSLRHTAALRCYEATHDVLAVQRLLGHRSLDMTARYLATLIPARDPGPTWPSRVAATSIHLAGAAPIHTRWTHGNAGTLNNLLNGPRRTKPRTQEHPPK